MYTIKHGRWCYINEDPERTLPTTIMAMEAAQIIAATEEHPNYTVSGIYRNGTGLHWCARSDYPLCTLSNRTIRTITEGIRYCSTSFVISLKNGEHADYVNVLYDYPIVKD